ncbi:MAG TPA: hypothetical protein VF928_14125 [Usitatibacteraceae bacterium]
MTIAKIIIAATLAAFSLNAMAKLPPPPPVDPKVAEEKAAKDKAAAEKGKADQAKYEDLAVANFRANMKKAGKPVPKPTPIVAAAAPAPAAAVKPAVVVAPNKKK